MKTKQAGLERLWEIDFARGLATVLMLTLHWCDDLVFLQVSNFKLNWTLWFFWQRITASLFLLLVGVSLTLSRFSNGKSKNDNNRSPFKHHLRRGLTTVSLGMVITILTKLYLGEGFVRFGVLHLIGAAVILSYPFLTLRLGNLFFGVMAILIGRQFNSLQFPAPWLLWAGLRPGDFYSIDYFPVFPWFGVVLFGLFLGNVLYSAEGRRYKISDLSRFSPVRYLCCLGKNSLAIYLIHQPVFILLLKIWHSYF